MEHKNKDKSRNKHKSRNKSKNKKKRWEKYKIPSFRRSLCKIKSYKNRRNNYKKMYMCFKKKFDHTLVGSRSFG